MSDPTHGTYSRYVKHGCRCDECKAAGTAYAKEYRERLRLRPPPPKSKATGTPRKTPPVRTYGEPWDSIINAGAYYSVPPSGLPRNNDTVMRRETSS